MFHPISAFIAWRYSLAGKHNSFVSFINRFSVAGIALGLMALIVVVSVMNGFEAQLKSRILGLVPHIVVQQSAAQAIKAEDMHNLPNVRQVMPYLETEGVVQSRKALRGVQIQGIVPDAMQHSVLAKHLEIGRLDDLSPGSFNVIISQALSQQLQVATGDTLRVLVAGATVYTPFGRLPSQKLVTISGVHDVGSRMDEKLIFMQLSDTQRLLRQSADSPTDFRLFLHDAFAYQQTLAQINQHQWTSQNWRDRQGPLFDAVKMEGNMMFLMLTLIIAVAAFNIVSALVMVVSEKQGDIAILQTQGLSRSRIMHIFMLNGVFNGIKGTAIGLVLGLLLTFQLNNILHLLGVELGLSADGNAVPVDLRWMQVAIYTVLSLALCFIASLYPAYRAMQTQPASALQND
ncbi:lipoprotein-releasing ABC transporter permease subunit [Salinimonas sediminis]|uniref:Lipoprotein-releasing ABC transporter permease subunit n=1 Tax=Salinimonas sediminis TaxID=2303538 RepID=A0A346NL14_9ALTE|nr:lipoprotein-releasing ABC transporter permease subunit [Salinimonas sediminis]AXR06221.1 lipoprotein-releasing ABC transporter permease subunit [Salinimonas sediminis]